MKCACSGLSTGHETLDTLFELQVFGTKPSESMEDSQVRPLPTLGLQGVAKASWSVKEKTTYY
eukprot:1139422-Pelagomonas_calceolata.AAC.1